MRARTDQNSPRIAATSWSLRISFVLLAFLTMSCCASGPMTPRLTGVRRGQRPVWRILRAALDSGRSSDTVLTAIRLERGLYLWESRSIRQFVFFAPQRVARNHCRYTSVFRRPRRVLGKSLGQNSVRRTAVHQRFTIQGSRMVAGGEPTNSIPYS